MGRKGNTVRDGLLLVRWILIWQDRSTFGYLNAIIALKLPFRLSRCGTTL